MDNSNTISIKISEDVANTIERATYTYNCRKDIIKSMLRDEKGTYNQELMDYYQKLYEEAYTEFMRVTNFIRQEYLNNISGRYYWRLDLSTNTINIKVEDAMGGGSKLR